MTETQDGEDWAVQLVGINRSFAAREHALVAHVNESRGARRAAQDELESVRDALEAQIRSLQEQHQHSEAEGLRTCEGLQTQVDALADALRVTRAELDRWSQRHAHEIRAVAESVRSAEVEPLREQVAVVEQRNASLAAEVDRLKADVLVLHSAAQARRETDQSAARRQAEAQEGVRRLAERSFVACLADIDKRLLDRKAQAHPDRLPETQIATDRSRRLHGEAETDPSRHTGSKWVDRQVQTACAKPTTWEAVDSLVAPADAAGLLALHDDAFVQQAYSILLGRQPDPDGLSNYLRQVRAGIAKEQIVAALARSEEGRRRPSQLPGLDLLLDEVQPHRPTVRQRLRRLVAPFSEAPQTQLRQLMNQLGSTLQTGHRSLSRLQREFTQLLNERLATSDAVSRRALADNEKRISRELAGTEARMSVLIVEGELQCRREQVELARAMASLFVCPRTDVDSSDGTEPPAVRRPLPASSGSAAGGSDRQEPTPGHQSGTSGVQDGGSGADAPHSRLQRQGLDLSEGGS